MFKSSIYQDVLKDQPGFLKTIERADGIDESISRAKKLREQYDRLIILGIGGSSLGARAIMQAMGCEDKVWFFENVDAIQMQRQLEKIKNFSKIHWCVISKSGKTIETLAQLHIIDQVLASKKINLKDNCTVISEKTSNPLTSWAALNKITILEMPKDVGGRFSVLTAVGMFPAAFAGLNVSKFIEGAKEAIKDSGKLIEFCSQVASSWDRKEYITVLWTYSDLLKNFGLWFQQLWAESLGKKQTLDGKEAPRASTPLPLVGTNDQHSVLQQITEGTKDKFVVFLRVQEVEQAGEKILNNMIVGYDFLKNKKLGDFLKALCEGTQKSLLQNGVSCFDLTVERIDEKNLGYLFMFFEMIVAMLGKYHNINTFDQPGVELSKKFAIDALKSSSR